MTSFGMLNCPEFRTLSRICPDLTSKCVAVQALIKMQLIILTFLSVRDAYFELKRAKSIFGRGSAPDSAGEVYDATPSRMGKAMPPRHTSPSRRLDRGVVAASKSVPNYHHTFIVTSVVAYVGLYVMFSHSNYSIVTKTNTGYRNLQCHCAVSLRQHGFLVLFASLLTLYGGLIRCHDNAN